MHELDAGKLLLPFNYNIPHLSCAAATYAFDAAAATANNQGEYGLSCTQHQEGVCTLAEALQGGHYGVCSVPLACCRLRSACFAVDTAAACVVGMCGMERNDTAVRVHLHVLRACLVDVAQQVLSWQARRVNYA